MTTPDSLHCEQVPLETLAKKYGTPLFVYSLASIRGIVRQYREAFAKFDPVIAYAVKANPSLGILREIARDGAGADIVSGGELRRALDSGVPPNRIVFAGVGKSSEEMEAALRAGILLFNVESLPELRLLAETAARLGVVAPVAVRVNPDVDPRTHAYISTGKKESKFGLDMKAAMDAYEQALTMKSIAPIGIHCHIGSQITQTNPFVQAAEKVVRFIGELRAKGAEIRMLDLGGGLGIRYHDEKVPTPAEMADVIGAFVEASKCRLILEPGRSVVGAAGTLVTSVHYVKETPLHRYVVVDAAMNDLIRPALYDAYHPITHVVKPEGRPETKVEIVGPVCETGDFLAKGRVLALPQRGDLLAIGAAGAYGMAMASNYNLRPRAAEVLVDGARYKLVRRRETYDDMFRTEMEIDDVWN